MTTPIPAWSTGWPPAALLSLPARELSAAAPWSRFRAPRLSRTDGLVVEVIPHRYLRGAPRLTKPGDVAVESQDNNAELAGSKAAETSRRGSPGNWRT